MPFFQLRNLDDQFVAVHRPVDRGHRVAKHFEPLAELLQHLVALFGRHPVDVDPRDDQDLRRSVPRRLVLECHAYGEIVIAFDFLDIVRFVADAIDVIGRGGAIGSAAGRSEEPRPMSVGERRFRNQDRAAHGHSFLHTLLGGESVTAPFTANPILRKADFGDG